MRYKMGLAIGGNNALVHVWLQKVTALLTALLRCKQAVPSRNSPTEFDREFRSISVKLKVVLDSVCGLLKSITEVLAII